MDDDLRDGHRRFAVEAFNRCWDLLAAEDRTADDDVELVLLAAASRWHWGQLRGAEQVATGDWQLSRAAAAVGLADLALRFAGRNLDAARSLGWTGWRLASAHEGMARACAAAGDAEGRAHHLAAGTEALASESSSDDRAVIEAQLASVPEVGDAG